MHFLVPSLVAAEVQAACEKLLRVVQSLCETTHIATANRKPLLSAPSYLFVSRHVAAAHSHLSEAGFVQAFDTYLPGQMANQWHTKSSNNRWCNGISSRGGWVSVLWLALATGFSLLQLLGTAPSLLQRMLIRFIQPFFVSAVILAYYLVAHSPLLIAGFGAGFVATLGYGAVRYIQEGRLERMRMGSVTPLDASASSAGLQELYMQSRPLQLKKPEVEEKEFDRSYEDQKGEEIDEIDEVEKDDEDKDYNGLEKASEIDKEMLVVVAADAVSESSFSVSMTTNTHRYSSSDTSDLFEFSFESSLCSDSDE